MCVCVKSHLDGSVQFSLGTGVVYSWPQGMTDRRYFIGDSDRRWNNIGSAVLFAMGTGVVYSWGVVV